MDVSTEGSGGEEGMEGSSKRKAEDFLRRVGQTTDAGFTPTMVMPGDDVTDITTRVSTTLNLGIGLVQRGERVVASRAGFVRHRPPCTYWVDSNQRRYIPRAQEQVIGIVEDRFGLDWYKVGIFGSSQALLGQLAFDGATKRNKPNLKAGALVFCRVQTADRHMEPELTCLSTHHGVKKDWVTGQSTFGELKGGLCMHCSVMLARSLVRPGCRVLTCLARHVAFELAVGANGAFWVDSASHKATILVCNAILNSEVMTDEQTEVMVARLLGGASDRKPRRPVSKS